jgi:integrase
MDRKWQSSDSTKHPEGIEIRSGKLRIHFYYRGVRCRESLNLPASQSNIKYAVNLRGEILNAIGRGMFNYVTYFPRSKNAIKFGYKPPSNITIGTMLENYLKLAERTLEFSTSDGYRKSAYNYLIPAFKDIPIRNLTPAMLREWVIGLKLNIKTIKNALIPLRAIIETALVDEIIDKNPLDHIILSKLVDKKTSESDYEVDPFTKEEIEAILNTAEGQIKNLFQFAFFTGLRTSEFIPLEWGDIDWIKGEVHVRRAYVRRRIKSTKTKSGKRKVLLLPPALEALKSQKAYTFLEGKQIFHYPLRHVPWQTPTQIRDRAWVHLLRRASVRYRNPYQTRHTYASMMLSNGENIMWVAKQMGHVTVEMVIKTYGKWIPDGSINTGYKLVNDWSKHLVFKVSNGPNLVPEPLKNDFFEEEIPLNQLVIWRSGRDSNPRPPT